MDIFQKVKSLNLPIGEYVVCGGGSLAARGIREARDVNILVLPALYQSIKEKGGWQETDYVTGEKILAMDGYQAAQSMNAGDYKVDAEKLIKSADIIEGLPFLNLSELVAYKKARGKEKDLKDIELIESYLKDKVNK